MTGNEKKVFVALSGGVDSSTAAALLLERGFDCEGVFMITHDEAQQAQLGAEKIGKELGIKLHILDVRKEFGSILEYFCSEYEEGRTPNPCVLCNRHIKFGKLLNFARDNGAEFFTTGHYARVLRANDGAGLYSAVNTGKDQSYALTMIDKEVLEHIILPMGEYTKEQTRQMAGKFGLSTKHKEESQEICFIPNNNYVAALEKMCPELVCKGNIVDSSGKVLGEHNGVHRFTIGQRRGLRVAMGVPYYVTKIDAQNNTVTLGPKEEVMHSKLFARGINWLTDRQSSAFRAKVKIRYNTKGAEATVRPQKNSVVVEFDEPVSAITPGQLAAFYAEDDLGSRVIGGGWIEKVSD